MNKKNLISSPDVNEGISALLDYKRARTDLEARFARESDIWKSVYSQNYS